MKRFPNREGLAACAIAILGWTTSGCGTDTGTPVAVDPGFITASPTTPPPSPPSLSLVAKLFHECMKATVEVVVERVNDTVTYVPQEQTVDLSSGSVTIAFVDADPDLRHQIRIAQGTDILFDTKVLHSSNLPHLLSKQDTADPDSCVAIPVDKKQILFPSPAVYAMFDPLAVTDAAHHPETGTITFCTAACPKPTG